MTPADYAWRMAGIATFGTVALDCPDPVALCEFYAGITGGTVHSDDDDPIEWVQLEGGPGAAIAFQRVDDYSPPEWPGQSRPQQVHLDFYVDDLDEGERRVLELGATKHDVQPGTTFRVFLDPAGHPFCLCKN